MTVIAPGIQLHADLRCDFEGHAFSIQASDDRIVVEVSDLMTGVRLIRKISKLSNLGLSNLGCESDKLVQWLELLQSQLEIRVSGICVARAGGVEHSVLARMLCFKGMRLMPVAVLRSALMGGR